MVDPIVIQKRKGEAETDGDLVSVITATYNRADYLPEAIESVLGQTHKHLEYHIIDDGSTDDTRKVVERYLSDGRVRYYHQENRGQAVARNVGLRAAKGEFISFLDSDNLWEFDKLETQLTLFRRMTDVDVIYGDLQCIDDHGKELDIPNMSRYSGFIMERLLLDNCVSFNSAMFRRKCYEEMGGPDEALRRSDDYELWLRYSTRYKFYYLPRILAKYRIMQNQLSHNKEARFEAVRVILTRFMERHPERITDRIRKNTWCRFYVNRGRHRAAAAMYGSAFADYVRAMGYTPISVAPWRAMARMVLLWR